MAKKREFTVKNAAERLVKMVNRKLLLQFCKEQKMILNNTMSRKLANAAAFSKVASLNIVL